MTKIRLAVAAVVAAIALAACQTVPTAPARRAGLAITNITVIDPATRKVLPRHSIFIDGDRIVAVLPVDHGSQFVADQSIDGSDKFAIPGLMDMHVHEFLPKPPAASLNLLVANGVTGIREMSGDCWEAAGVTEGCIQHYRALQAQIRAGAVPGPDLLYLASPMVMGPTRLKLPAGTPDFVVPNSAEAGRMTVRRLAARLPDLIKTHDSIPTDVFAAMMDEARSLGIEVSGHVPFRAGVLGAARMGFRSIEHARDPLYDCSRYGPEFRRQEADYADGKAGSKRPVNMDRLSRTVAEFDPAGCDRFLRSFATSGAFYVPTHVTREMEALAGDAGYRANPARKYILAERNKRWEADLTETAALSSPEVAALKGFYRHG